MKSIFVTVVSLCVALTSSQVDFAALNEVGIIGGLAIPIYDVIQVENSIASSSNGIVALQISNIQSISGNPSDNDDILDGFVNFDGEADVDEATEVSKEDEAEENVSIQSPTEDSSFDGFIPRLLRALFGPGSSNIKIKKKKQEKEENDEEVQLEEIYEEDEIHEEDDDEEDENSATVSPLADHPWVFSIPSKTSGVVLPYKSSAIKDPMFSGKNSDIDSDDEEDEDEDDNEDENKDEDDDDETTQTSSLLLPPAVYSKYFPLFATNSGTNQLRSTTPPISNKIVFLGNTNIPIKGLESFYNWYIENVCRNPNVPNGKHLPYPGYCNRFIHCDNYKAWVKECGIGLHFNRVAEVCDWPATAGCM